MEIQLLVVYNREFRQSQQTLILSNQNEFPISIDHPTELQYVEYLSLEIFGLTVD